MRAGEGSCEFVRKGSNSCGVWCFQEPNPRPSHLNRKSVRKSPVPILDHLAVFADIRQGRGPTLVPDIVAAIVDETLPPEVTLFDPASGTPLLWDEQRALIDRRLPPHGLFRVGLLVERPV